jgi:hypothetical protein
VIGGKGSVFVMALHVSGAFQAMRAAIVYG